LLVEVGNLCGVQARGAGRGELMGLAFLQSHLGGDCLQWAAGGELDDYEIETDDGDESGHDEEQALDEIAHHFAHHRV
jgi:hypothetical protein